jgi:hypothetical protein
LHSAFDELEHPKGLHPAQAGEPVTRMAEGEQINMTAEGNNLTTALIIAMILSKARQYTC